MARPSQVVSPEKQAPDGSEEELDVDDWELPISEADANDDAVLHLGSDLPDITLESEGTQLSSPSVQYGAPVARMGGAVSVEQRNEALQATVEELRKRAAAEAEVNENGAADEDKGTAHPTHEELHDAHATEPTTVKASNGRLKRPFTGMNNPAYRNPVATAAAAQRKLGPTIVTRKSIYDLEEGSPEKLPVPKMRWTEQPPQFSPRRTARKKGQQGNGQHQILSSDVGKGLEQEVVSSPRRSRRQQEREMQETPVEPSTSQKRKKLQDDEDAELLADTEVEDSMYKDFFRDSVAQRYVEEDADAGADEEEDEGDDNIVVAEQDGDAVVSEDASAIAEEAEKTELGGSTEESPKAKKRPGRPRKSDVKTPGRPKKGHAETPAKPRTTDVPPAEPSQQVEKTAALRRSTSHTVGNEAAGSKQTETAQPERPTEPPKAQSKSPQKRKRNADSKETATAKPVDQAQSRKPQSKSPEKATQTKDSTRRESALENLRRQRTQDVGDEQEDEEQDHDRAGQTHANREFEDEENGLFVSQEQRKPGQGSLSFQRDLFTSS